MQCDERDLCTYLSLALSLVRNFDLCPKDKHPSINLLLIVMKIDEESRKGQEREDISHKDLLDR